MLAKLSALFKTAAPQERSVLEPLETGRNRQEFASIAPIAGQKNWRFAMVNKDGEKHLHLDDGRRVFAFRLDGDLSKEDVESGASVPMTRFSDLGPKDFGAGGDVFSKGILQVHKTAPGMIHATFQDGKTNSSMLFEVKDGKWSMTPKQKTRLSQVAGKFVKEMGKEASGTIAVDLDGTLAHHEGKFDPNHVGKPVPRMLEKVKAWLKDGKKVVIFTARAADPKNIPVVKEWLKEHGLEDLEVTNEKTPDIIEIHDDRAVAIEKNTGKRKHAQVDQEKKAAEDVKETKEAAALSPEIEQDIRDKELIDAANLREKQTWDSAVYPAGHPNNPSVQDPFSKEVRDENEVRDQNFAQAAQRYSDQNLNSAVYSPGHVHNPSHQDPFKTPMAWEPEMNTLADSRPLSHPIQPSGSVPRTSTGTVAPPPVSTPPVAPPAPAPLVPSPIAKAPAVTPNPSIPNGPKTTSVPAVAPVQAPKAPAPAAPAAPKPAGPQIASVGSLKKLGSLFKRAGDQGDSWPRPEHAGFSTGHENDKDDDEDRGDTWERPHHSGFDDECPECGGDNMHPWAKGTDGSQGKFRGSIQCHDCGHTMSGIHHRKEATLGLLDKLAQFIKHGDYCSDKRKEIAAANKDVHPSPTGGQCDASNFPMGHVHIQGLDISIETAKGGVREDKKNVPPKWRQVMKNPYGYIRRFKHKGEHVNTRADSDGDHIDVFLGDHPDSEVVFVVDQFINGKFDEHKCILFAKSEDEARKIYTSNFQPGWKGLESITALTMKQFKLWIKDGDTGKPLAKQKLSDFAKIASTFGELSNFRKMLAARRELGVMVNRGAPLSEMGRYIPSEKGFIWANGSLPAKELRSTMRHELAHFYQDKVPEVLPWMGRLGSFSLEKPPVLNGLRGLASEIHANSVGLKSGLKGLYDTWMSSPIYMLSGLRKGSPYNPLAFGGFLAAPVPVVAPLVEKAVNSISQVFNPPASPEMPKKASIETLAQMFNPMSPNLGIATLNGMGRGIIVAGALHALRRAKRDALDEPQKGLNLWQDLGIGATIGAGSGALMHYGPEIASGLRKLSSSKLATIADTLLAPINQPNPITASLMGASYGALAGGVVGTARKIKHKLTGEDDEDDISNGILEGTAQGAQTAGMASLSGRNPHTVGAATPGAVTRPPNLPPVLLPIHRGIVARPNLRH